MVSFLDSNVLVYYVDPRDPSKQTKAEGIVESAFNGNATCLISVQALAEFTGREARTLRVRKGDFVYELCGDRIVPALVERLPDSPAVFRKWVKAYPLYGRGDECMNYAITDVGHGHVFTPEVFPAIDKIPLWCQRRILAHKKREEADVARWVAEHAARRGKIG